MGSPTCPYCMQRADRCACEDPRIVGYENATPTPPAPADDTGGASASEAMREACAKACRKVANGTRRPSGQSSSTLSRLSAIAEGAYMCEKAIRALPLPARREEAVVEAARAAVVRFAVEARNHGTFPVNECGVIDQTSAVYQSYIATLADLWRSVDALTAALRGTRPEGHSPASGQGGDK